MVPATAAGQILKTYFGLYDTDPELATLTNVIKIAERVAGQHRVSGSRSNLHDCWSRYRSVAHLWGTWVLRDLRFMEKPEVGYDYATDFQAFLQESEGHCQTNWVGPVDLVIENFQAAS